MTIGILTSITCVLLAHYYRLTERAISHTYRADSHATEIAQDALIYSLLDDYRFGMDIAWALV